MGRLQGARARLLCTVAFVLLTPAAAWVTDQLRVESGAAAVALLLGLVVAYLLSVGPVGGFAVAPAFALEAVVAGSGGSPVGLVSVAVLQALVAVAAVRLLEIRFAHHGPVRDHRVLVEYALVAAVALPLTLELLPGVVGVLVGAPVPPGPYASRVLADGMGVLVLTAGLRMLLMGERVSLDRTARRGVEASAVVTAGAVFGIVVVGGVDALVATQVVVLPVLLVALLIGTAAYAVAVAVTTVVVLAPLAVLGVVDAWQLPVGAQLVWWIVAFVGLLLATDGDRRRAAAREFQSFFARSATPTASVNAADGRIVRVNEALADLVGARAEDLAGRPVVDLVAGAPEAVSRLEDLLARRTSEVTAEFPLLARPDDPRWVRCVAAHVDLQGPQHDLVQVQFLDLTAERDRADSLERSNQALERFGQRVAHDLRQPVAAVATYASTLLEHAEHMAPDVRRTMYERLETVANRAVSQLEATFSASAVAGTGPVDVWLPEVVATVVGMIDIDLAESGGTVDTALAAPRVHADPSVLRQVLLNLLTNSCKYAGDEEPPRIRVASRVRGAGVEVTVTDNGTGIPADSLDEVFERGRRLDPGRADGRGHGLSDSRRLAEEAGGWLRAEPWADGARFVLWLPDPGVAGAAAATRVLLVDDEPDALLLLEERLAVQRSIDVVGTATSIAEAVEATRELRPDVVLLDRWLRDEDGLAGVVELARAHPDVRVVLLTADTHPGLDREARSEGVLRALDKTISDEDLVAQLLGTTAV